MKRRDFRGFFVNLKLKVCVIKLGWFLRQSESLLIYNQAKHDSTKLQSDLKILRIVLFKDCNKFYHLSVESHQQFKSFVICFFFLQNSFVKHQKILFYRQF